MAHLLGSKACIDSLRADLTDLDTVIHQLIGRTGTLRCHSWKFPDKIATDVNINELLQRYNHGRNDVDNQVSHIVLFEILIDRLLLILHGSSRLLNDVPKHFTSKSNETASATNQQTNLSVGLVVKNYWKKFCQLCSLLEQHQNECQRAMTVTKTIVVSNSTVHQHCQTIETSFSPCSSCKKIQDCLREQGQAISDLCHQYDLPSTLAHHRCMKNNRPEWFSSDDVDQWFEKQKQDFSSLSQQLQIFKNQIDKLKVCENQCKKLEENNRRLQQLINEDKQSKKLLQQHHDHKIADLKKGYEDDISRLNVRIEHLNNETKRLDECQQLVRIKDKQIEELKISNEKLILVENQRDEGKEKIRNFERNQIRLETELDVIKRDLEERQRDLQKERTRIENFIRQEQNSQAKQQTLIVSHDELSQESQLLKQKIADLELERDDLQRRLKRYEKVLTGREISTEKSKPTPLFLLNNEIVERQAFTEEKTIASKPSAIVSPEPDVVQLTTSKIRTPIRPVKSASTGRYQCQNCQKSYDDKRNYDIHKLYCRT